MLRVIVLSLEPIKTMALDQTRVMPGPTLTTVLHGHNSAQILTVKRRAIILAMLYRSMMRVVVLLLELYIMTAMDLTLVMFGSMIIHLILIVGVRFKAISMGRLQRIEAAMVFP